ncbi:MAG: primosomal protein [Acidobacterium ailaaui]|nr:primosomal protein [Pseudacidobacterium ailaaui]
MRQLLIETFTLNENFKLLNEQFEGSNDFVFTCLLQKADVKNKNGRIYPKSVLQKEIDNFIKNKVSINNAVGELDHSDSDQVKLSNASHIIRSIWWEGNNVMGKVEVLDTPAGNIVKTLIRENVTIGISSRGLGSLKKDGSGNLIVDDDFELITWDIVTTPSTPDAYLYVADYSVDTPMIRESIEYSDKRYESINNILYNIICIQTGVCCLKK